MIVNIIPANKRQTELLVTDFAEFYSEKNGRQFTRKTARQYLQRNIDQFSQLCFIATDQKGSVLGGVYCRLDPYYSGEYLHIDVLHIRKQHRGNGVGKILLQKMIDIAKQEKFEGIHFLADNRLEFPKSWYQKIGFKESGWVDFEAEVKDL